MIRAGYLIEKYLFVDGACAKRALFHFTGNLFVLAFVHVFYLKFYFFLTSAPIYIIMQMSVFPAYL